MREIWSEVQNFAKSPKNRKVAEKVANDVSIHTSTTAVARIRLADEGTETTTSAQHLIDNDLLQYYKFLADKGDVQTQVSNNYLLQYYKFLAMCRRR